MSSQYESTDSEATNLFRFLLGVEVIREYEPDAEMAVNNGFIYVGNYHLSHSRMTDIEKRLMEQWGWVEGDESWAFYV
ncbi:MAG: hypothetical protein F6K28_39150 [Microcoleus sp. SIO2G3]|nr:hypothetical protein [Microcoleus sp. SIO2G3]